MYPGDIATVKEIIMVDAKGFLWLRTEEGHEIRSHRNLIKNEVLEVQRQQQQLRSNTLLQKEMVIVPGQCRANSGYLFALADEAEGLLVPYFYETDSQGITGKGNNIPVWRERFREAAAECQDIELHEPAARLGKPRSDICWMIARKNGKWMHPVYTMIYNRALAEDAAFKFCPNAGVFYMEGFKYPCCYRADAAFPAKFRGTLVPLSSSSQKKKVTLLFHGFLCPHALHYHFWMHAVSGTPRSLKKTEILGYPEREGWEAILQERLPDTEIFREARCQEKTIKHYGLCKRCDLDQFILVHRGIAQNVQSYHNFAVTVLGMAKTNYMDITPGIGSEQGNDTRIKLASSISEEVFRGSRKYHVIMGIMGDCYDWASDTPTLHAFCTSLYLSNSSKNDAIDMSLNRTPETTRWRLTDVKRARNS